MKTRRFIIFMSLCFAVALGWVAGLYLSQGSLIQNQEILLAQTAEQIEQQKQQAVQERVRREQEETQMKLRMRQQQQQQRR